MESKSSNVHAVEILENFQISKDYRALKLRCREIAHQAKPGQFLMIRVSPTTDPLLPRPFSFCQIRPNQNAVTVLYKMGGPGTTWLSGRRRRDTLTALGPLGNPFRVPPTANTIVLLGGGIGVTPLISLGESLSGKKRNISFFLGIKTKQANPLPLAMLNFVPKQHRHYSTDDGSRGGKGHIVERLAEFLKTKRVDYIGACGPKAMLKALQQLVVPLGIPTEVAAEQTMACGLGYCLGCAVMVKQNGKPKPKLVCADGPVLSLDTLLL